MKTKTRKLLRVITMATVLSASILLSWNLGRGYMKSQSRGQFQTLVVALESFKIINGRYPTAQEGLSALVSSGEPTSYDRRRILISEIPEPITGGRFEYRSDENHYELCVTHEMKTLIENARDLINRFVNGRNGSPKESR